MEVAEKLGKHAFQLCRVSLQGYSRVPRDENGPGVAEAFPPFARSPKRLFAGRTVLFPARFGENMGPWLSRVESSRGIEASIN